MTELGEVTTVDVAPAPTVLLPLGAVEQHGPHLPLDTDARVAGWLVANTVAVRPDWLAAPTMPYGASGEHEGRAGTVSIGTDVLADVLLEWGRSACRWADRVLIVNGHGGNLDALRRAVPQLRREGRDVAWWTPQLLGGDAHAGHVETSLLLHLAPRLVRRERAVVGNTRPLAELLPSLRRHGITGVSPSGVLGDPTAATAQAGAALGTALLGRVVAAVERWRVDPTGAVRCDPVTVAALGVADAGASGAVADAGER